jgi:hypothetical protein
MIKQQELSVEANLMTMAKAARKIIDILIL